MSRCADCAMTTHSSREKYSERSLPRASHAHLLHHDHRPLGLSLGPVERRHRNTALDGAAAPVDRIQNELLRLIAVADHFSHRLAQLPDRQTDIDAKQRAAFHFIESNAPK